MAGVKYLILDMRAITDLKSAAVLDTADSLNMARKRAKAQGGGVIFESDKMRTEGDYLEIVYED